jgi:hypothetical protein
VVEVAAAAAAAIKIKANAAALLQEGPLHLEVHLEVLQVDHQADHPDALLLDRAVRATDHKAYHGLFC